MNAGARFFDTVNVARAREHIIGRKLNWLERTALRRAFVRKVCPLVDDRILQLAADMFVADWRLAAVDKAVYDGEMARAKELTRQVDQEYPWLPEFRRQLNAAVQRSGIYG
jgi:hypothetical protein